MPIQHIKKIRKVVIMCTLGSALEWYDFFIYTSLAPIISKIFFPISTNKIYSMALTFSIFSISFLVRPAGGMVFGYIADKRGRSIALLASLLLMAIPSLCITVLPGYNIIGIFSPVLLLILRILQSLSVGGEHPLLITYLAEFSPPRWRGLVCSYINVSTVFSIFLATIIVGSLNHILTREAMYRWGWKIPFAISFFLLCIGFYLRLNLSETEAFKKWAPSKSNDKNIILYTFKENNFAIVKIFLFIICAGITYYSYNIFNLTFLIATNIQYSNVFFISLISSVSLILFIQIAGYLSDIFGRKVILLIGAGGLVLFSCPLYYLFSQHSIRTALVAQIIFSIILGLYLGPLPAFIAEQTNTRARCTTISLSYNFSIALFGGTAPIIDLLLINHFKTILAPGLYLSTTALLAFIITFFMKEAANQALG